MMQGNQLGTSAPDESPGRPGGAWILAIDTSTEQAGLALSDGATVLERSWDAGRAQTTTVLPAIDALLGDAGLSVADLGAIAVATGPGTFTGLRVGVSIAKGLVLARDIPLVGVPTLEVAAAPVRESEREVVAVLPAGRGRVVWQRFAGREAAEPRNTTVPELIAALATSPGALLIGELAEAHRAMVEAAHPRVRWEHRRPALLAGLARTRLEAGEADDPVTLEPRYLHGVTVQAPPIEDRLKKA
ncbi:MAG TPA: tRNA (adenosine(37)-N6)-threonylcarbamoyltransferase complex dimerization subunit type 1 TsaB [Thermomicrobiales bacterium]|nr:tRNA (adenosine(37)-N6)-threonylcarbamoyltransferase complex dimerization subunit type 1 TsaB [Thermomicrobiales bacterium]